jgi:hypothetical protein
MSELREALRTLVANGLPNDAVVPIVCGLVEAASLDDCDDERWLALVSELGVGMLDADESTYDSYVFQVGKAEYLVLTEDERDSRWDDYLDSCLDDGGMVPGADSPYFDRDRWKDDARMDGAGQALSSYDGNQYEFSGFGNWFYIYRTN